MALWPMLTLFAVVLSQPRACAGLARVTGSTACQHRSKHTGGSMPSAPAMQGTGQTHA